MRIVLKTYMAGPRGSAGPGDVVDLPDAAAAELLNTGKALPVRDDPQPAEETEIEEAIAPQPEAATVPRKRGRGRGRAR